MIYLNNNTILQDVYIPRQDMLQYTTGSSGTYAEGYADGYDDGTQDQKDKLAVTAFTENGEYERENGWSAVTVDVPQTGSTAILEEKTVVISADTTNVTPSSGYDGMSAVTIDASDYAQENYDGGFEDGFQDGYSSGSSEGYESGYTSGQTDGFQSGYTSGETHQKSLLVSTAFTENGDYTREDGWSGVTVNVDTASTYNSGYTSGYTDGYDSGYTSGSTDGYGDGYSSGYTSGHTDGVSEEKAKMSAVTFTANTAVTLSDGSYSAVTVDVPQTGYTQQDLDNAFASGETVGENTIIATFSSTTATTNGQYGSSAHPLSSITVSVPTGSSINIEQNKSLTATTNGVYNINPSYIWQITYDHTFARRYDFTINGRIPYSKLGNKAYTVEYYDENTGEEPSVSVCIGSTNTLVILKNNWDEDDYGMVDFRYTQGKYRLEFDDDLDSSEFSIIPYDDGEQYDAMSSVTFNVNVPKIVFADYIHTETLSANTYEDYIDTGLYPTTGITFRVKGYRMYENGERIVGWCPDETTHSDSNDFRLFWAGGETVYFDWGPDWNGGRINAHYFNSVSGYTDITCGNHYVYDNVCEQMICSGSVKSLVGLYQYGSIRVDVGSWWLKSLEIYDGNTLLFSGTAAYDTNGNVGLFDSVSQTLKTAVTNQQMVYEFDSGSTLPLSSITFTANTSVTVSDKAYTAVTVNVPQTSGVYGNKTIIENGTYSASTDNLDGYSAITVNVPQCGESEIIICSSGQCWFDLGYTMEYGDYIDIEHCTFGKIGAHIYGNHQQLIGGNSGELFRIGQVSDNKVYFKYFGQNVYEDTFSNDPFLNDNHLVFKDDSIIIDGNIFTSYTTTYRSDTPNIIVFANTSSGGDKIKNQTAKVGTIRVYDLNGNLKATFKPMLDEFNVPFFKYVEQDIDIYASGSGTPLYEEIVISSLSSITITANTTVTETGGGGYSAITVNVPSATGTTSFTANGIYDNAIGWTAITVSVPQSGSSTGTGYMNLGMNKSAGYRRTFIMPDRRIELDMKVNFSSAASEYEKTVVFSQIKTYNGICDGGLVLRKMPTDFGVGTYGAFGIIEPTTGGTPSVTFQSPSFLLTAETWYDMSIVCTFDNNSNNRIQVVASINNVQVANFSVYTNYFIDNWTNGLRMFTINDTTILNEVSDFARLAIKTLKVYDTTDDSLLYNINYSSFYNDFI